MPGADYAWTEQASCKGRNPALWFDEDKEWRGLMICHDCPVQMECLEAALEEELTEKYPAGVRGGRTAVERGTIRARRKRDRRVITTD